MDLCCFIKEKGLLHKPRKEEKKKALKGRKEKKKGSLGEGSGGRLTGPQLGKARGPLGIAYESTYM